MVVIDNKFERNLSSNYSLKKVWVGVGGFLVFRRNVTGSDRIQGEEGKAYNKTGFGKEGKAYNNGEKEFGIHGWFRCFGVWE
ncbi:hypothetical protein ACFX19_029951 [Malus domestica]